MAPVTERLRDVNSTDLFGDRKIDDGTSDAQDAMKTTRRQSHRRRGVGEKLAARFIRRRDLIEQVAVGFRIGTTIATVAAES